MLYKYIQPLTTIIFTLFFFCNSNAQIKIEVIKKGKTTIIGKALNSKPGAIVISENDSVYYIKGLDSWQKKFYGQTIIVTGSYIIEKRTYQIITDDKGQINYSANLPESMSILKRPRKIKLLKL